ncbi:MAG: GAF domain-containing protein [Promethearchaeota archaeon]|nr:MAG: GAF domain-containing protein [Candidatus Lokiarchaeota archaeon]
MKNGHKKIDKHQSNQESNYRYKEIFNKTPNGIVIYEAIDNGNDFIIRDMNNTASNIEKVDKEKIIGKRLTKIFPCVDQFGLLELLRKVWKTGNSEKLPLSKYQDNRISGWRENFIFRLSNGLVVAVYSNADEIKKRERDVEKALKESERRRNEVSSLLKATKSVLEYKDFKKTARAIFDECKEITGAHSGYIALLSDDGSENELLFLDSGGLPCSVDPDLPMPIRGLRGEAYRTGKPVYDNHFMKSKWVNFMPNGHVKLNNVLFAPLNLDGKTIGLIGLANKEGGFNENDKHLASGLSELVSVALNNSMMIQDLESSRKECLVAYNQTNLYKDLFIHDISNILQNISYASNLIEDLIEKAENEKRLFELINLIKEQLSRGSSLISSIRKLSKIELLEGNLEKININDNLNHAIKFTKESYPNKKIEINFSPNKSYYILGNQFLVDVFENLLINAVKYNNNELIILTINLSEIKEKDQQYIILEFMDNARGIHDSMKRRLFKNPIKQKTDQKGMGLGLILSKNIVEIYNGKIWVENRVKGDYKQGSNFIIKLPIIT